MKQKPFTAVQAVQLSKNALFPTDDMKPVVKYFCPWGGATWLIASIEKDGTMFGLCDLGHGCPELGYVTLWDLKAIRGPWGLTIERDLHFIADKTLTAYADEAREQGRITA